MLLEPIKRKFESFNWNTIEINGHDHNAIYNALISNENNENPKVIIAHTTKGKGVDFMENKLLWHYKSPNKEQLDNALNQLNNSL